MAYAVLGPRGTFSEKAACLYWGQEVDLHIARNIPELFSMVQNKSVEGALVPLENSLAGSINSTMRALEAAAIQIRGEIAIPIKQHLMARRRYRLEEVELLISQPTALMQCDGFVKSRLADVRTEISDSTARAAQIIKGETRRAVSIGNSHTAKIYDLQIVYRDIADNDNVTRFVHISSEKTNEPEGDKSSMIFSLLDKPGSLCEVLGIFARENMNLSKLESRNRIKGRYSFYVDVDAGAVAIRAVLEELKECCDSVKYLGSYKKSRLIGKQ
jgi:prephenate dehydratase